MLLLMTVFAALVFTAQRHADLPVGRRLHELLIAGPAAWLSRTPPRRLLVLLVLLAVAALVWIEIGPLLAAADIAPAVWFADMALYMDAVLLAAVAFAAVHVRSAGRWLSASLRHAARLRSVRRRAHARSSRPRRTKPPAPANDDARGPAILVAA